MDTFGCKKCGYIAFDQAPVDCPVCGVPIENFEHNNDVIKKPMDPVNLTEMEKKHIPVIIINKKCDLLPGSECIDIHLKVGEIEHVMETEHYITFIDFYVDKKYIARVTLTPKNLHPAVLFHLRNVDAEKLIAVENYNIHGYWMKEINL